VALELIAEMQLILRQIARKPSTPAGFVASKEIAVCSVTAFVSELRQFSWVSYKFGHSNVIQTVKD
jgi:hypothetical protein